MQWFPGWPAGLSCTKALLSLVVKGCGQSIDTFHCRSGNPDSRCYYPNTFSVCRWSTWPSEFIPEVLCELFGNRNPRVSMNLDHRTLMYESFSSLANATTIVWWKVSQSVLLLIDTLEFQQKHKFLGKGPEQWNLTVISKTHMNNVICIDWRCEWERFYFCCALVRCSAWICGAAFRFF